MPGWKGMKIMTQADTSPPAPSPTATIQSSAAFPPVYYDSPVTMMVLGVEIAAHDLVTATITAGAPYFSVSQVAVIDPVVLPVPGPGGGQPAVTGPIGVPESVKLSVTVNVPAGASLPLGPLAGTAELVVKTVAGLVTASYEVELQATLLGTIIGQVSVQPATVTPGQPVLIEVLNTLGEPLTDPAVTVTIQGIPGASRWEQYATPGTRTLSVIASDGKLTETGQGTVAVSGSPLKFTLDPPAATQLPIIEASTVPGQPYAGSFTLGTPRTVSGTLVTAPKGITSLAPAAPPTAAPPTAAPPTAAPPTAAPPTAAPPTAALTPPVAIVGTGGLPVGRLPLPPLQETSYTWDFGDGSPTVTTASPAVVHDFFPAVNDDALTHSFDVSCTAVYDKVTVKRTIVLHSAYGLCKRTGVVVPPVTGAPAYAPLATVSLLGLAGQPSATVPLNGFSASMIVNNLEPTPLVLQSLAIVPLSDDPSVAPPAPSFTSMSTPQQIAANSASALGAFVPFSALSLGGPPANAFALYYQGVIDQNEAAGTSVPACFSVIFRIPASYSGLTASTSPARVAPWDGATALGALGKVTAVTAGASGALGGASVDSATRTITVPLSADAHDPDTVLDATSTVRAVLSSVAAADSAVVKADIVIDLTDPPPVAPGNACYPDDISDADAASANAQQLVCQLVPGPAQTVTIPSAFQNALAGDVILSPAPTGDGDLIAAMFQSLTPPQHYGHSGLMTANFYEITHCTASVKRISDNVNKGLLGVPVSLNEDMLQYAWPGSVTQTIDAATTSVPWTDPGGATYWETSFNDDDRGSPQQLIPPLVVKPLPWNEETARPLLRQAADLARSKGAQYDSSGELVSPGGCYYSFYNYTKPQISSGFTDPAPAGAGWAAGHSPAVCSSFVWMCMKATGIPCVSGNADETLADFTAAALATGEPAVSPDPGDPTLDGLVYYSQAVRQAGAAALYNLFMEQALDQEDGLGSIPGINDAVAGPIADQLLNCFAFGNPNMIGDSSWKNPGDGNAVSPENITLWSPPYFGYAEPLQYLPAHTDQYTPSEWVRVTTRGTISGTVTRGDNGQPVAGALVWANLNVAGMWAYSGANGSYTLANVPLGPYDLKASATLAVGPNFDEFTNGTGLAYTLTAANNGNGVQDLVISSPAASYRQINITYQISCDHGDGNPFNQHGVETAGPYVRSLFVNPGQMTQQFTYTFDYAGGGYFSCSYTFYVGLLEDQETIQYSVEGVLADDNGGNPQASGTAGPYTVGPGQTFTNASLDNLEYSQPGYHNGPANFTWNIANAQQTG
jgi:Carboxypeptidase regulatory-like domain